MPSFKEKFGKLTEIQQFSWSSICAWRDAYTASGTEEALFDAEELMYSPGITE